MADERIQKILARAGFGSRRKCEELIAAGRVSVNGAVASEPGVCADAARDSIALDGLPITLETPVVFAFNKPPGCVTTVSDPQGRKTVVDFFSGVPARVFPVGRLDLDTEGLLIMTNDGALANRVTHPGNKVFKTYEAWVNGVPDEAALERLRTGVTIDEKITSPAEVEILETQTREIAVKKRKGKKTRETPCALLQIRIAEGRKRQVKRMVREISLTVIALKRTRIGALALGDLPQGKFKHLGQADIDLIFAPETANGDRQP